MYEIGRISIRVLGRFAVMVEGGAPNEVRISSRKACALLAYLAMHPDRQASREHLATFLWGDRRDEHAHQSLRQCLLTLRRELASLPAEILNVGAGTVGLETKNLTIDAAEFLSAAESSEESDLERAATLYRGEFLSEFNLDEPFDGWVRKTRSQLDAAAANVFQSCATFADARGDGKQATRAIERLLALDPLREDWQRLALSIYARYRGRASAAAHAEALVTLLKTELGVEPEPATKLAIDNIKRGTVTDVIRPDLDAETPAPPDVREGPSIDVGEAPQSGRLVQGLSAFTDRIYARTARWPLGIATSIVVAAVISTSAVGFMFVGHRTATLSRIATSSGAKLKPLVTPPGLVPIVILPFTADDGDGPNQRAADSLTDDLINTLSRFAVMRVISRQTAFTYKGRSVDVADVGAELGVRYAVEGSFQTAGSKLGINFQLVDTTDRLQIWSDRIEWDASDRFTIQEEIATRIARELKTGVTIAEGTRLVSNHAAAPDVDALVMQGWALSYRSPSRENVTEELALFEEALRREPDLRPAMVGTAMALTTAVLSSLADDPRHNLDRADELLDRVLTKSPDAYQAHYWKGVLLEARGDNQAALRSLTKCIDINPSATYAHSQMAEVLTRLGRPQEGLDYIQYAMRLSPRDPRIGRFYLIAGQAELELHHDGAAAEWFQRAIASQPRDPSAHLYLAATYALMGNKDVAATYWKEFRNLSAAPAGGELIARLRSDASVLELRSRLDQGLRLASAS